MDVAADEEEERPMPQLLDRQRGSVERHDLALRSRPEIPGAGTWRVTSHARLFFSRDERSQVEQSPTFWTIEMPSLRATLVKVLDIKRLLRGEPFIALPRVNDRLAALSDWAAVAEDVKRARIQLDTEIQSARGELPHADASISAASTTR